MLPQLVPMVMQQLEFNYTTHSHTHTGYDCTVRPISGTQLADTRIMHNTRHRRLQPPRGGDIMRHCDPLRVHCAPTLYLQPIIILHTHAHIAHPTLHSNAPGDAIKGLQSARRLKLSKLRTHIQRNYTRQTHRSHGAS